MTDNRESLYQTYLYGLALRTDSDLSRIESNKDVSPLNPAAIDDFIYLTESDNPQWRATVIEVQEENDAEEAKIKWYKEIIGLYFDHKDSLVDPNIPPQLRFLFPDKGHTPNPN